MQPDPLFDVSREVVVITGALGQLGGAYALEFLARGARVAVCDLPNMQEKFEQRFGEHGKSGRARYVPVDITDETSVAQAGRAIRDAFGTPSVLINNAAIDTPPDVAAGADTGPFEKFPVAAFEKVLKVNVTGTMICCQAFGGMMAEAGRGSIINIGSIYGMLSPDQSLYEYRRRAGDEFFKPVAYSASKSAIYNLSRYLAVYWAKKGVRVNTLTLAGVYNNQDSNFLDTYTSRIPVGRMAEPTDYLGAVLFLASAASRYMTGANLVVDGGWTAI